MSVMVLEGNGAESEIGMGRIGGDLLGVLAIGSSRISVGTKYSVFTSSWLWEATWMLPVRRRSELLN